MLCALHVLLVVGDLQSWAFKEPPEGCVWISMSEGDGRDL